MHLKTYLIALIMWFPAASFAQTNYIIKGNAKGLKSGTKLFLVVIKNETESIDSAIVKKGKFTFRGTSDRPHLSYIFNGFYPGSSHKPTPDYKRIFIEEGPIKITSGDKLKYSRVSGTQHNREIQAYADRVNTIEKEKEEISTQFKRDLEGKSAEEAKLLTESFNKRYGQIHSAVKPIQLEFVQQHPNSPLTHSMLPELLGNSKDLAFFDAVYGEMNDEVKASAFGKYFLHSLEVRHRTAIGQEIMDFTQNDENGNPVNLSAFRKGKYVLIDFWASWCEPCRAENPVVVAAYHKYKSRNFDIIGVALESGEKGKESWLRAIKDDQLPWTQVSDFKYWKNEVAVLYNIQSVPANFLVNPEGIIIARNLRGKELEAKLAEIFD